jgi:outer membrane protein OmpA-like peptidoglycan-associated protein/tetratricopeptide (TPR) repeat protein
MNKKLTYLLSAGFMVSALLSAQNKKTEKANKDFNSLSYAIAIDSYETLVDKGYTNEEIYKNLGEAHYQNANYIEAADWFSKLFKLENTTVDADDMYRYAQSLKSSKEYEASAIWMQKYQMAKTADVRAKKIANSPDYLDKIEKQSWRYDIKSLAINSSSSDFAPSFNGEQLVFSTARDTGTVSRLIHTWNNQPFTNLYSANATSNGDFNAPSKLSSLNKKTHETSAVFTKDGSTVYFTRNNSENGNFARDAEGVSRLKIFRANLRDDEWTNITELPFNGADFSTAHPALSPDERELYFASDMTGTHGASDIFVVAINEDGSFGTPQNLGNTINTEARETFPFVTDSNVLYFASDGHPGLGGLDVYATSLDDLNNLFIVNSGKPVNSEQDDFSFIINDQTKKGFFASNREGGLGSDDIYGFIENIEIDLTCNTLIAGLIKDQKDGSLLPGAHVSLVNTVGTTLAETISEADGSFSIDGDCREGNYKLMGIGEGYNPVEVSFTSVDTQDNLGIEILLNKVLKEAPVGTDLVKFLNLNPVYFGLDKSIIRPDAATTLTAVVNYLNEFPNMKIQVQSHTDVKASKSYNDRLSKRRAESTVAYLITNGMDKTRVNGQGFGESKLTNDCTTLEKCNDEQHEENRRSEFIVQE